MTDRDEPDPSEGGMRNFSIEYSSDIFPPSGLESYMDGDFDFLADFLVTQNGKHQS
jgi:hypothetical protein